MMLHIPLRARLTTEHQNIRLYWRRVLAHMQMPSGAHLLDTKQSKLPPLPRRCYGRSPGRQSKNV